MKCTRQPFACNYRNPMHCGRDFNLSGPIIPCECPCHADWIESAPTGIKRRWCPKCSQEIASVPSYENCDHQSIGHSDGPDCAVCELGARIERLEAGVTSAFAAGYAQCREDDLAYVASKHTMHDQLGNIAVCKVLREVFEHFKTRATTSPPTAPASDDDLPAVGGRKLTEWTVADFERNCRIQIRDEQEKPDCDNRLIAVLCNAVRLAREQTDLMTNQLTIPTAPAASDVWTKAIDILKAQRTVIEDFPGSGGPTTADRFKKEAITALEAARDAQKE